MVSIKAKEVYKEEYIHKEFFTGGELQWSKDGQLMFCQCGSTIQVVDIKLGKPIQFIGEEHIKSADSFEVDQVDQVVTFTLSEDNLFIVSAHKSGLLKHWLWNESKLVKHWKSIHKGRVSKVALSSSGDILASGGSDSSVRLWDLNHFSCTHNLQGLQGVVSILKFHKQGTSSYVFAAADDYTIKAWDISTGNIILNLEGHYSLITGIGILPSRNTIVSCGRDKVLILWDLNKGTQRKVIPLYESVEGLAVLPESFVHPGKDAKLPPGTYVAVAGQKGVIRIWEAENAKEVFVQTNSRVTESAEDGFAITRVLFNDSTRELAVATVDHNILVHSLDSFKCVTQLTGYSDEILDLCYVGPKQSHLAVATNSNVIKLYCLQTWGCQLLKGHQNLVVALSSSDANPCLFASASKDKSVKVWLLKNDGTASCILEGTRHANSVTAVALSHLTTNFMVSASEDTTIKLWHLPKKLTSESASMTVKETKIAHEKDINYICMSPNDKIVASASMDKTAKLWNATNLELLGVLRGHRRGVWACCFSPVDQVLLTCSADTTLKFWSLADLSCVKTLEGHDSSVLRCTFLTNGTQVASCGGDGLLKLWCIKTSECVASFDCHDGKIWALAVSHDESRLITGATDSKIIVWKDVTEEVQLEKANTERLKAEQEQQLSNLIHQEDFLKAIKLAISLDRPATLLSIIQNVAKTGRSGLTETVIQLEDDEKQSLINYVTRWNSNSKTCHAAQLLISIIVEEVTLGRLKVDARVIETLLPYTERHFKRLTQLLQDVMFLDYTQAIIQPVSSNAD